MCNNASSKQISEEIASTIGVYSTKHTMKNSHTSTHKWKKRRYSCKFIFKTWLMMHVVLPLNQWKVRVCETLRIYDVQFVKSFVLTFAFQLRPVTINFCICCSPMMTMLSGAQIMRKSWTRRHGLVHVLVPASLLIVSLLKLCDHYISHTTCVYCPLLQGPHCSRVWCWCDSLGPWSHSGDFCQNSSSGK